ncbi:hypothetical protein GJ496_007119 [Pomphorhynchus laevis]|nr:hypothetical protein GJ496_007119 [Pomphorhynchus laevis]
MIVGATDETVGWGVTLCSSRGHGGCLCWAKIQLMCHYRGQVNLIGRCCSCRGLKMVGVQHLRVCDIPDAAK